MRSLMIAAIFVLAARPCIAEMRTWTSAGGKTVEAEFVRAENGRAMLRGPDGKKMHIRFTALSKADQAYIAKLYSEVREKAAAAKKEAEERAAREKAERRDALVAKWNPGQISHYVTKDKIQASYHVYIPTSFDPAKPAPLVYAFSPGGNGRGQLNAMKQSAEKFGWIVVGCDKLRNGMEGGAGRKEAIAIEDSIIADVQAYVPHDQKRVYLSGMSGGAMRSYRLAARRQDLKVAGILAFGGWMGGKDYQKKLKFQRGGAVAMVNGDKDTAANDWVKSDGAILRRHGWNLKVFKFPGGHKMAPPNVVDEAIAWIERQPLPR